MSIVNALTPVQESLETIYSNSHVLFLLTAFLLIATYTDLKSYKIPDKLNGFFFILRFVIIPVIGFGIADILGAIFAFVTLMIPAMIKNHKMGGDIKCLTVVGLYVGIYLVPFFLIFSCIYFILYTGLGLIVGKSPRVLPFAPFFLLSHITLVVIQLMVG